jgi:transposase
VTAGSVSAAAAVTPAAAGYAELQVATNYSFLRGASHPEELFAAAAVLGLPALGVVDRGTVAGIVRCWEAARATSVRLVAGCRVDLVDGTPVLLYPTDRPAWSRLCRLLTLGKGRTGKGGCRLAWDDLAAHAEGLLAVLVPEEADDALAGRLIPTARCVDSLVSRIGSACHGFGLRAAVEAEMAVSITRTDHTAAELREFASKSDDAAVTRRLLALALALDGHKREDAARLAGMDRQTLRDWVHRYNAQGVAGLADRHGGGVARRLSAEQEAEVASWMRTGPDLETDKVVRWRCVDIQARIARLFGVALHERSVGKLLRRLRFSHVSARPQHPRADLAAQASFGARSMLS